MAGTMHFGTATDEATSFAILDRYAEAGGTFTDTAARRNEMINACRWRRDGSRW
jgi:hypothetical protein